MAKIDFSNFTIGEVFNGVSLAHEPCRTHRSINISYPSRLEAMALDPAKIADNNNLVYEAGQIDFCVALFKNISVSVSSGNQGVRLSERTPRKSLVLHAALIMKQALDTTDSWDIDVEDTVNLRHCGLGSSSSLIAGVASAINELYGNPITAQDLVRYCAQNHGEEIDGSDDMLVPVQCIGGSAVCGNFDGGLIILAGQAAPIFSYEISTEIEVVIGVPNDFTHPDSETLMQAEVENIDKFKKTGNDYGKEISYRLIHEVMPGLANNDLEPCKQLIFDYRWNMGSIENCSFVFPRMNEIAERLRALRDNHAVKLLALSSVGPGFFALTTDPGAVTDEFHKLNMKSYTTSIHNHRYIVNSLDA